MASPSSHTRPTGLAIWLIIAGVIGWFAAFNLTVEKIERLADPSASASKMSNSVRPLFRWAICSVA